MNQFVKKIIKTPKFLLIAIIIGLPVALVFIIFLPILILVVVTYYFIKFFKGKDIIINKNTVLKPHTNIKRGVEKYENKFNKVKLVEVIDADFKKK